jgi:hypothetical protein
MWPMMLDMSKFECKKALRTLELDAYASVVTAFRAQGDLTANKADLLRDLQMILRISVDRHKAELRRATNDEKLFTIAKRLSCGECVSKEWTRHSKRLVPLLPTLDAPESDRSYYRILADHVLAKALPVLSLYPDGEEPELNNNDPAEVKIEQADQTEKEDELDENQTPASRRLSKKLKKKMKHEKEELLKSSAKAAETRLAFDRELEELDVSIRPIENEGDLVYLKNGYAVDPKHLKGKIF